MGEKGLFSIRALPLKKCLKTPCSLTQGVLNPGKKGLIWPPIKKGGTQGFFIMEIKSPSQNGGAQKEGNFPPKCIKDPHKGRPQKSESSPKIPNCPGNPPNSPPKLWPPTTTPPPKNF